MHIWGLTMHAKFSWIHFQYWLVLEPHSITIQRPKAIKNPAGIIVVVRWQSVGDFVDDGISVGCHNNGVGSLGSDVKVIDKVLNVCLGWVSQFRGIDHGMAVQEVASDVSFRP